MKFHACVPPTPVEPKLLHPPHNILAHAVYRVTSLVGVWCPPPPIERGQVLWSQCLLTCMYYPPSGACVFVCFSVTGARFPLPLDDGCQASYPHAAGGPDFTPHGQKLGIMSVQFRCHFFFLCHPPVCGSTHVSPSTHPREVPGDLGSRGPSTSHCRHAKVTPALGTSGTTLPLHMSVCFCCLTVNSRHSSRRQSTKSSSWLRSDAGVSILKNTPAEKRRKVQRFVATETLPCASVGQCRSL